MSYTQPWRRSRLATAVAAGALAATLLAVCAPTVAYASALTGTITVSKPKLAALTVNQVLGLTVSGTGVPALTEDNVASIGLGPTPCNALTSYVVTSATSITVKTPATCPAGAGDVVINFVNLDTLTKTNGITFVTPPAIDVLLNKPVINDNSASVPVAGQQQRFATTGGQVVRVKADPGSFAFLTGTTAGLAVSMGGKAGTEVKVYADLTSTVPLTATSSIPANGNTMSFKTAAGMNPNDSSITLTQNGVSKTFLATATGAAVVAAPTVKSLSVTSGKAGALTVSTVITGTNFGKVLADLQTTTKWLVKFCSATATVTAASTTGLSITVTVPDLVDAAVGGLGTGVFAGVCPVTVTDVVASQTSAVTAGSNYTVVSE